MSYRCLQLIKTSFILTCMSLLFYSYFTSTSQKTIYSYAINIVPNAEITYIKPSLLPPNKPISNLLYNSINANPQTQSIPYSDGFGRLSSNEENSLTQNNAQSNNSTASTAFASVGNTQSIESIDSSPSETEEKLSQLPFDSEKGFKSFIKKIFNFFTGFSKQKNPSSTEPKNTASTEPSTPDVKPPTGSIESENELPLYRINNLEYLYPTFISPREIYDNTVKEKNNVILAKKIIRNRIDRWWPVIQKYLPFPTKEHAYAFFIGDAALESTLDMSQIAGGGHTEYAEDFKITEDDCAHSVGLNQVAETGFDSTGVGNKSLTWDKEDDVPEIPHAKLNGRNFYDPATNTDMAIRKMCHFGIQAAKNMGMSITDASKTTDFWVLVLKGHNTGHATYSNIYEKVGNEKFPPSWYNFYAKAVGTSGNFLKTENHLYDSVKTWDQDPKLAKYELNKDYFEWILN